MDDKKDSDQGIEFNLNLDTTPIFYTDFIQIEANEDGVTLNICQRVGSPKKLRIVSRVGMSREHAKKFVKALKDLLELSGGQIQTGKAARA
ncbi:MAG: hypothetical protein UU73_C0003G0083 [Candidatus Daviesbacteria bacterium GW2011_GWA1_41_61]|uniref:DUF3467 domain-containing protein n=1 Tax=Candidatus Daviesbacteria bacterium GW2011_GWA2_40_9 TaxID=1618424 RepID=A0A0G0WG08_9BACT|nr:MAG: hypothetical protein UU26_C0003G0144 [Candidatus Daviesbacteria bacterium GW2011_GWC1_40_9]KKR83220.1 MAG: hypothetical protein UU29_C0007G0090 [Candidatus Daviesbacteria bacterium GW2011_GWA2_40_9]KKR93565.1 MAG: hypothetical protein UU44_C0002G0226 [Candidatus Daviesbacteria bacterium GW2011_GWB1_41_15]KKS14884.1 MAG: hypothetical protein UU73_C0003G0083 [Candidatus Daviesbacteria bacterium GW2011_GWA1_41_61]